MIARLRELIAWARTVNWQTEPVVIMGVIKAVLAALAGTGLVLADHQVAAISLYVTAACMILAAVFVVRPKVTSPATRSTVQAAHDSFMAAAAEAIATAGPGVQQRARLCPGTQPTPVTETLMTEPASESQLERAKRANIETGTLAGKRLGRRQPKNAPALQFAEHLITIPTHPVTDTPPVLSWPMDHNDQVGCCVVAGLDHFRQVVETTLTGTYNGWTDGELLALYQTQNPGFKSWADAGGPADNGMDIQTLLEHLVATGVILGFAKVDHTNLDEMRAAIYLDLGLVTGEVLTTKNMSERTWDWHAHDQIEGGHCTVAVGYKPGEQQVSWGSLYAMTDAFVQHRIEEAWFIITQAHVDHPAFRATFSLASFAAAYKQLTGRDFPVPVAPPQPPPTPAPGPAPDPGPDATFQEAVAAVPGLDSWLAARAAKKGMSPDDYAVWLIAGEAHLRPSNTG